MVIPMKIIPVVKVIQKYNQIEKKVMNLFLIIMEVETFII